MSGDFWGPCCDHIYIVLSATALEATGVTRAGAHRMSGSCKCEDSVSRNARLVATRKGGGGASALSTSEIKI